MVPAAFPAAPWQTQLQDRLLSDWTAFFVEVGNSLASEQSIDSAAQPALRLAGQPSLSSAPQRAMPQATAAQPPRLHLVETKAAPAHSPASSGHSTSSSQNPAHPSSTVVPAISAFFRSSVVKIIALRFTLGRWTMKWTNGLLAATASTAWAPPPAILFQLPARWVRLVNSWYVRLVGRARAFGATVAARDWPRLKTKTYRWLSQPCDPTQWRLMDSRLFEQMFHFNHKKM
jgi:hypothetical protein